LSVIQILEKSTTPKLCIHTIRMILLKTLGLTLPHRLTIKVSRKLTLVVHEQIHSIQIWINLHQVPNQIKLEESRKNN